MAGVSHHGKRRVFTWPEEARQLLRSQHDEVRANGTLGREARAQLIANLAKLSGNPRDACLRFLRRMGLLARRAYRKWTKPEQQRLVELIDSVSVQEAARILRRPVGSVRSMLHRLGLGAKKSREWFTPSLLAQSLHISRDEVNRWLARGWLRSRDIERSGVRMRIIDPDDFCEFVKRHGRDVVGRRLSYEGLLFVRNYVLPPKHAKMLSVRGPYKKRPASVSGHRMKGPVVDEVNEDGEEVDQSA